MTSLVVGSHDWLMFDESPAAIQAWIEEYLTVPTPLGQVVPFKLYPQQIKILEDETGRDIIVKGRQTRASSIIMARNVRAMTNGSMWNATCVVGAQDDATTAEFRRRIKHHIFSDLNSKGFSFKAVKDNDDELIIEGLNNRFVFISGEMKTIVRGYSAQIVHLSEFAHWNERMVGLLMGGLLPAVPGRGRITIESTPKGEEGAFYDYAMKKVPGALNRWQTHLYPWWMEPRYRATTDSNSEDDLLLSKSEYDALQNNFTATEHEKELMQGHGLIIPQIIWRRVKQPEQDRTHAPFLQEYVEDLDTCWLGVQGKFFDTPDGIDHIAPYRDNRRSPTRMLETLTYRMAEVGFYGPNLKIWEEPDQNDTYVIGFDAAGGGMTAQADWSVAYVIDANKEKVVASLRVQAPPRNFALMLCAIATYYRGALVNGERSHHGKAVFDEMLAHGYTNLYYHIDRPLKRGEALDPGVYPSSENRLKTLERLKSAITAGAINSYDEQFVQEMNIFTWQKYQNRLRAQALDAVGQHDDSIFAMAWTWFIVDKVRMRLQSERRDAPEEIVVVGRNRLVVDRQADTDLWRRLI